MIHSKLDKARAQLIINQPFFASILLTMPLIEDAAIPTMATDGETIRFNPAWTESLSINEITFVLAHETLHCVFDHMGRRGERTPNRWNQAADYIINELLVNDSIGSMPAGGLYNPKLTADAGNTAEGVYKLLPDSSEKKETGSKGGAMDRVHDAGTENGTQPTDAAKIAEKSGGIKIRVTQARNVAKMQGKLSAGLERLISDVLKPRVDWREILRRFVSERTKVTATFARPKRRFLAEDLYLPSLSGEKMGRLVVAVDCSGSVDELLLSEFIAEINAIRVDLMPSMLEVVYFDSKVCHVDSIPAEDSIEVRSGVGGGGTAFSPVIDHVNAMPEEPACVVFLTDLCCSDWGTRPAYPVLWCVYGQLAKEGKAPFGEVVGIFDHD